jgi:hypothetical protein
MNARELRRRIASCTYRLLHWGRHRLPTGVRSLVGLGLIVAGAFGFLPVLGFWMIPAGLAFVALDIPNTRHRIEAWMLRLALEGELERERVQSRHRKP